MSIVACMFLKGWVGHAGVVPVVMLRSMMGMTSGEIHFEFVFCVECVWMVVRYVCISWSLSQECVLLPVGICSLSRSLVVIGWCCVLAMGVLGFLGRDASICWMGGCMVGRVIAVDGGRGGLWWGVRGWVSKSFYVGEVV